MINLIGILIMLGGEAFVIYVLFLWQKEKYEKGIAERDCLLGKRTLEIKEKNIQIKELQDELQQQRRCR